MVVVEKLTDFWKNRRWKKWTVIAEERSITTSQRRVMYAKTVVEIKTVKQYDLETINPEVKEHSGGTRQGG